MPLDPMELMTQIGFQNHRCHDLWVMWVEDTWTEAEVVPVLNDDVTKAAMLTPAQGLQLLGVPTLDNRLEWSTVSGRNHVNHTIPSDFEVRFSRIPSVGMDLCVSMAGPIDWFYMILLHSPRSWIIQWAISHLLRDYRQKLELSNFAHQRYHFAY